MASKRKREFKDKKRNPVAVAMEKRSQSAGHHDDKKKRRDKDACRGDGGHWKCW